MSSGFYPQIEQQLQYFISLIENGLGDEYLVYDDFSDRLAESPLTTPTATVGIRKLESSNGWFADYLGLVSGEATNGKLVTVTYEVTVHSPVTMGGSACTRFLCKVRDAIYAENDLFVGDISSGEIKYDRSRRCLYMPVQFKVKYIV